MIKISDSHLLYYLPPSQLSPGPAQLSCHVDCVGAHLPGAALAGTAAP